MRTLKYLLFAVFVLTLLTNCSKDDNRNASEFKLKTSYNLDDLDYRQYSLVLEELFPETENPVVFQATSSVSASLGREYIQSMKDAYPEMDTTVFSDYILVNDSVYYLDDKFSAASKQVTLVSNEEIQYIFNTTDINKGWEEFYRRFPNSAGEISFSRIGYNRDKTQAMVEIGNMYASLGGEGRLIFLKLENNEWKIAKAILTWMS